MKWLVETVLIGVCSPWYHLTLPFSPSKANASSQDVCWALYFGRDFCGPAADRCTIPLPFVDLEFDQIPWYYAPANIPPQPNYLTLTFFESSRLFVIIRNIVDMMCVVLPVFLVHFLTLERDLRMV